MKALDRLRLTTIAWAISSALAPSAAFAQAAVEWKFFTYFPVNDKPAALNRAFAEDVAKATGGKLKITVFAAGELPYKAPDGLRVVSTNQVQMADAAVGFLAGDVPELNVLGLPFLCTSYEHFERAVPQVAVAADALVQQKFGATVGIHWTTPPQNLWLNKPITKLDDLKGLKVRAWNPDQVDMMRLLGGSAVTINSAEVIPALERKVIDGAITSSLSANDWKAYEIVRTGYMVNLSMGHQMMFVNSAELGKLAPDVRATLLAKFKEWTPRYQKMSVDGDVEARRNLVANKVSLVDPTSADRQKAQTTLQPMWADWAKKNGPVAQQLLSSVSRICTN